MEMVSEKKELEGQGRALDEEFVGFWSILSLHILFLWIDQQKHEGGENGCQLLCLW